MTQLVVAVACVLGMMATYDRGQALDAQTTGFWNKGTFEPLLPDVAGHPQITLWTNAQGRDATSRQFDLQYTVAPSAVSGASTLAEVVLRLQAGHTVVVHSVHGKDHSERIDALLTAARDAGLSPQLSALPRGLAVVSP
ncbi:MAG: hypothetical protein ACI9EF_001632 [Pseudohongiellaceae bacterium]|jgi:hypothetical protein